MDPGWKPALAPFVKRLLTPWRGTRFEPPPQKTDSLILFRTIWLSLVAYLYLFLVVMSFVGLDWSGDAGRWPLVLTLVGTMSLGIVGWIRQRPLDATDASTLRGSYTTNFYIGFAVAEFSALLAFVASFITGRLWVYLIGLAWATVGMVLIGPTKANLENKQRLLRGRGSPLSLIQALRGPGR